MASPFLLFSEACEYLRVHPNTLTRWIKKHKLRPGRAGRDYRFTKEMLDRFVLRGAA